MYVRRTSYVHKAWPHTVYSSSFRHSTHFTIIVFAIRFVFGALICCVAVRRSADRMQTHRYDRCIKLFIFHTKINYRFYSHTIKKHGICVWLKKNSAEFFIKPNIGTRIGKDSQILPIRCFTDIAKNRPDPMSDPIIGWSLLTGTHLTPGWREAIMVKCLAQGHKCHGRDSNPHSAANTRTWVR